MQNKLRFIHPRFWPTWLGYVLLWIVVRLPHRLRMMFGAGLGLIGYHLIKGRRRVVEKNVALCFPDLSEVERNDLVRRTFRSGGMSIIETAISWLRGGEPVYARSALEGVPNLKAALAKGKGVILLGTHMQTLDLAGAILSREAVLDVMYRANKNALMEAIMTTGRERLYPHAIERSDIRQVIRNVKAGHVVWYGPDQDYGARNSVFVPFLGVSAATTTALSRIAKITGAPVVPFSHFRVDDDSGYRVVLYPVLEGFPSDSPEEDCRRINEFVESCVTQYPEQYWWFHRRFKTRPEGEVAIY
jgi:KDO2-lipid IV(A) lauroyltransferase